ncbi:hypothetical protein [Streptomyces rubiginosohelvolus]|uniref:Uncharacterized protein n=1 Tax=Streptomyces rubiginosohelvolus TaxID=67362 RepID=A0ABQ3BPS4_9ACTN|nr:hypothetical protein [Streptomyces pluricolorescens]GGZ52987.1 hypothetical protein GCM10010328_29740 [Streptomyces pluricolorescens]
MTPHTAITAAILGVLPGATPEARITVEQPLQVGRDTWTGTVAGLAQRIANATEGKDTREGESTPGRAARTAFLIALARALREQPTGGRILDGLDELGEAVVCDEDPGVIASWTDALSLVIGLASDEPKAARMLAAAEELANRRP